MELHISKHDLENAEDYGIYKLLSCQFEIVEDGISPAENEVAFVLKSDSEKRIKELEEENKRFLEALEFYADRSNWGKHFDKPTPINDDCFGKKAREALGGGSDDATKTKETRNTDS